MAENTCHAAVVRRVAAASKSQTATAQFPTGGTRRGFQRILSAMSSETGRITAYIALGANLGDRAANLRSAIRQLDSADGVWVDKVASFLENPAVGGPADSPPFINTVIQIQTHLPPHQLLTLLRTIEDALGRVRDTHWGPRTIDLDILLYGDQVINTADLVVPHPRMHERDFVLVPLAEIAPDLVHPTMKQTVRQLLESLKARD